jgi:hypothetical protein
VIAFRLLLVVSVVQLHLAACPWPAFGAAAGKKAATPTRCACCCHDTDRDEQPAPGRPDERRPAECPCLACSPGYVPTAPSAASAVVVDAVEALAVPTRPIRPAGVWHAPPDRPPR